MLDQGTISICVVVAGATWKIGSCLRAIEKSMTEKLTALEKAVRTKEDCMRLRDECPCKSEIEAVETCQAEVKQRVQNNEEKIVELQVGESNETGES